MAFTRPDIYRPPSEARSYYLPLTSGCSNNSCTFCLYSFTKLGVRDVEEIKEEIDALALYVRSGVRLPNISDVVYYIADQWDGKGLFLQDGDALVYPYDKLVEVLTYLNDKLPFIQRIATYATGTDILRRTPEEMAELKRLKVGIIYMGLESGDEEVLRRIKKNITAAQMIEAARRAKQAGMLTSIMYILGLGGTELSEQHALNTAEALTAMDPDYAGALTLNLVEGTPILDDVKSGKLELISEFDSLRELLTVIENAEFTNCFFSSMHASNYLPIRGRLPDDRDKMIAVLRQVIEKGDRSTLRPEHLRGL